MPTGVVERLGAARGSVTDLYLPRPIAMHIFELTAPLYVGGIVLNTRNVLSALLSRHGQRRFG